MSSLIFGLILGFCTVAQQTSPILLGSWTATASPNQIFRGTWSAQVSLRTPNRAIGSWTLLNEAGDVLLEGTWSAQKTGKGWQGTWTARTAKGQSFTGTWTADMATQNVESFAEMLKITATKEVAGSWRSGRYQGNWWLKGSQTKKLMGAIPPVVSIPHSATSDFSLSWCLCCLRVKENGLAGFTEASDGSSRLSTFVFATWREGRGESTEAQRGIFQSAVNRAAKAGW